jgi:hypothetical protein
MGTHRQSAVKKNSMKAYLAKGLAASWCPPYLNRVWASHQGSQAKQASKQGASQFHKFHMEFGSEANK